jgi:hypothetical protein
MHVKPPLTASSLTFMYAAAQPFDAMDLENFLGELTTAKNTRQ